MPFKAALFDFDGTLVETRTASWELFEETNREFGLGLDTQEKFFRIFEGNFFASWARHCQDEAIAAAAAKHFMELVRTRYYPSFIPGIVDVIHMLAEEVTLAVLSSNMEQTIRRILSSGGVVESFSHILAGDLERSKATAIKRFLDGEWESNSPDARGGHCESRGFYAPDEVVMVTDTVGDVSEALACEICVYGVNWGMHGEQQLRDAGAARVAHEPRELLGWINGTREVPATLEIKSSV